MSDAQAYGLSASDLTELMPFHIVFDRSLRVLQRGRVLARCCPGLGIGAQLPDHFRLVRPDRAFDESALSTPDAVFILQHVDSPLTLRGGMRRLSQGDAYLFAGLPWITSLAEMQGAGLSMSDFPVHDPMADFLFLLQGKNTALAETERLASALTAQRRELFVANRMLTTESTVSQGLIEAKDAGEAMQIFLRTLVTQLGWEGAALWREGSLQELHPERWFARSDAARVEAALASERGSVLAARSGGDLLWHGPARLSARVEVGAGAPFQHVLVVRLPGLTHAKVFLQLFRDDAIPAEGPAITTLRSLCARYGQYIERQHAQGAMRDSEARLRAVLDNAAKGIMAITQTGVIEICNQAAADLFGVPLSQMARSQVADLPGVDRVLRMIAVDADRPGIQLRSGVHVLQTQHHDGADRWLRLSVSQVTTQQGALFIVMVHDLTQEYRARDELQRAKAQAESASRAKSEFLAVVSHEIRTPLNVIIGMTELAVGSKSPSEQQEYLSRVRANAEALLHLVFSMLDMSKIEAQLLEIETIPFDCAQLVGEVAEAVASRLMSKRVAMVCAVSPEVPPLLMGDPTRLRQILMNLLGNASKFTEKGEVQAIVDVVGRNDRTAVLRFTIADTGIGIPREVQSRIFERFFQADSSTSRRYGGSGLGLTISRSLVSLMGGRIWFESEPGVGSQFCFELPLALPARTNSEPLPSAAHLHVMVVNSSVVTGRAMAAVLRHRGYQVTYCTSIDEARTQLQTAAEPPHALLCDAHPPAPEGPSSVLALIAQPRLGRTRVILVTPMWTSAPSLPMDSPLPFESMLLPVSNSRLLSAVARVTGLSASGPSTAAGEEPSAPPPTRPRRILVVEDNPDNQRLAWHTLAGAGYAVDLAENGAVAVTLVMQQDFDLILMDVEMPEMDGFQATRQIRERTAAQGRPRVPIVGLTAHAVPVFRQRCLDAGMDDYATKPIPRVQLLELVANWLDRRPVILAADDSEDGRLLMRELLRQLGNCRPLLAENGQQAIELLRQREVALVLLDMEMPVLDGYATARAIRSMPRGGAVPIIAVTGHQGAEATQRVLSAGCTAMVSKPIRARDLRQLVEHYVSPILAVAAPPPAPAPPAPEAPAAGVSGEQAFRPDLADPAVVDLIPGYLARCRSDAAKLSRLQQEQQYQQIAVIGHKMKGTAASFGFPGLGQLGGHLEDAARNRDVGALTGCIAALDGHLRKLPDMQPSA